MQQIILKKNIEKTEMDALQSFLKSWDIKTKLITSTIITKKITDFSLSVGIWKDYNIDSNEIRKEALNTNS